MTKIKVREATGPVLDLLVSRASNPDGRDGWGWFERDAEGFLFDPLNECRYSPSTDWAQGGPIIERLKGFEFKHWLESSPETACEAHIHNYEGDWIAIGPTPLIAAMRCFVTSKLGDEVDVLEELLS